MQYGGPYSISRDIHVHCLFHGWISQDNVFIFSHLTRRYFDSAYWAGMFCSINCIKFLNLHELTLVEYLSMNTNLSPGAIGRWGIFWGCHSQHKASRNGSFTVSAALSSYRWVLCSGITFIYLNSLLSM